MKRQSILVSISLFLIVNIVNPAKASIDFYDDFESYSVGSYPGDSWVMRYNAINDPSNNKVVNFQSYSGNQSLQLYGKHGTDVYWCSGATISLSDYQQPFSIESWLMPGDESEPGGHYFELSVGLAYAYDISYFGIWKINILSFDGDNIIRGLPDGLISYTPYEWYKVTMLANPTSETISYWINGTFYGTKSVTWSQPLDLAFESGDGIGWVDGVKVDSDISIIPAPGAIILGGIGISVVNWLRRRKTI